MNCTCSIWHNFSSYLPEKLFQASGITCHSRLSVPSCNPRLTQVRDQGSMGARPSVAGLLILIGCVLCALFVQNTGRCARPGCTYTGQILLWPERVWPCCLLSERLLQSEGLFSLYVFSLSGKILCISGIPISFDLWFHFMKRLLLLCLWCMWTILNSILICLQSGEKKKDDETVDSLGEDLSVWTNKWELKVLLSPFNTELLCVFVCGSRSSGEGSGPQWSLARTEGWAQ